MLIWQGNAGGFLERSVWYPHSDHRIKENACQTAGVITLTLVFVNDTGWAEIAWRLENDIDPHDQDSFFDHCEECMPDFIKLVHQDFPEGDRLFRGMGELFGVDPNRAREMLDFRVQMEEALQPVHENLTVIRGQLSVLIDQDRRPSEV